VTGLALVRASPADVAAGAAVVAARAGVGAGGRGGGSGGFKAFSAREVSGEGAVVDAVVVRAVVFVHDLIIGGVGVFGGWALLNPIGGDCDALIGIGVLEIPHGLVSVGNMTSASTHQSLDLFLEGTCLFDVPLVVADASDQGIVLFHGERFVDPGGKRLGVIEDTPHGFGVGGGFGENVLWAVRAAVDGKVKAMSA